ncbi:proton-transporting V-type ATPase complex assembly regulator TMEM9-like isoform X3 [Mytilus galloprovincialis]|uniref:proton-transporting V-type ATPase complex assembly regulator TMEM9-like isoform X3 n=1 Tax=Mytilus galloprovincialis TaxID=29158 RepID=UPI003F7CA113
MTNYLFRMRLDICLLYLLTLFSFLQAASQDTSFEDVRCKCVCPPLNEVNSTQDRTVFISANVNPNMCTCVEVVKNASPKLCAQCECKYESRNTTTIKVVVIFTICVVSLLFVYMVFLFLLDHLVSWRPSSYQQHVSEEVNLDEHSVTSATPVVSRAELTRQRSIINRVTDEQKRWKGTVKEQRRNIYDKHSMLN